jgi:hypothetical protein
MHGCEYKPLSTDPRHRNVICELSERELTCVCGYPKYAICEEISDQLDILPT